ncbi:hypothetical protein [Amaricoccus solimangrovi]|uniref:SGNH/GDSL hydrolase family protein n=1 Tax=Amaricoccus solimangrovi TaxID=2589815 RepID=A0A501WWE3_9RHOB|nr:hypothetical protein [Amaricoccus solimangrovi]TPE52750.1 hypothetical protein FJM51_06145 [Amaricoccus solimangrovi]
MAKLTIAGNSHIRSVKSVGRDSGPARQFLWSSNHVIDEPDGGKRLKPETIAKVREAGGPIFSLIGGNGHNVFGLVYPVQPFDFHHPDHPERPPAAGAWIIPYEQVWDSVMRRSLTRINELRAFVAAFPGRVIHLESPPPIPSQKWLTAQLAERMASAGIPDYEVAAPSVRYKLWRVNSAIFRQECARHGIPFIPAPTEACDAEGFLLRRFWADPTHANAKYGALLLRQMTEHLDVTPV